MAAVRELLDAIAATQGPAITAAAAAIAAIGELIARRFHEED